MEDAGRPRLTWDDQGRPSQVQLAAVPALMAGDVDRDGADEVIASGNLGSPFGSDGDETVWVFLRP